MQKKSSAFSLIELMIVLVIIAILASLALPSYRQHIRTSRREEVISDLLQIQLLEERYRLNHNSYATLAELNSELPSNNHYNFLITTPSDATAYTLTAKAKANTDQRRDKVEGTSCATLTLTNTNVKTPALCW